MIKDWIITSDTNLFVRFCDRFWIEICRVGSRILTERYDAECYLKWPKPIRIVCPSDWPIMWWLYCRGRERDDEKEREREREGEREIWFAINSNYVLRIDIFKKQLKYIIFRHIWLRMISKNISVYSDSLSQLLYVRGQLVTAYLHTGNCIFYFLRNISSGFVSYS